MAYIFSLVEQAQITAAATQGPAPGQPGNFVAMYSKVRDIVSSHISDGTIAGTDKSSAVNVLNWLNTAIGANGDVGFQSAFIRTYTNRRAADCSAGSGKTSAKRSAKTCISTLGSSPLQNLVDLQNDPQEFSRSSLDTARPAEAHATCSARALAPRHAKALYKTGAEQEHRRVGKRLKSRPTEKLLYQTAPGDVEKHPGGGRYAIGHAAS
ncbi:MAG: hypothetical protein JWM26_4316 [Betaproteobacteria bacterium]|nr:hypothetical protein [Betaproteobacteria bacterium]